jgi:hypothetical protein
MASGNAPVEIVRTELEIAIESDETASRIDVRDTGAGRQNVEEFG